jgi:hypothetical protein
MSILIPKYYCYDQSCKGKGTELVWTTPSVDERVCTFPYIAQGKGEEAIQYVASLGGVCKPLGFKSYCVRV